LKELQKIIKVLSIYKKTLMRLWSIKVYQISRMGDFFI
jgi:hypothetical protein